MTTTRVSVHTIPVGAVRMFVQDCPACGVLFGITEDYETKRRRDGGSFRCPNGHSLSWTPGKSDEDKLRDALARNTHLEDQLFAAAVDAEQTRGQMLRDRVRFSAGICPCCRRSFENVRRHMSDQHPGYAVQRAADLAKAARVACSCGRGFSTLGGLHNHQSRQRAANWWKPDASPLSAHLTEV